MCWQVIAESRILNEALIYATILRDSLSVYVSQFFFLHRAQRERERSIILGPVFFIFLSSHFAHSFSWLVFFLTFVQEIFSLALPPLFKALSFPCWIFFFSFFVCYNYFLGFCFMLSSSYYSSHRTEKNAAYFHFM